MTERVDPEVELLDEEYTAEEVRGMTEAMKNAFRGKLTDLFPRSIFLEKLLEKKEP